MSDHVLSRPSWWYRPGVYIALLCMLVLIHGAALRAASRLHKASDSMALETRMATVEAHVSRAYIMRALPRHPRLLLALSLLATTAIVLFCVGVGLMFRRLSQRRRWRAWLSTMRERWPPSWSLGDLGRVVILAACWITVFPLVALGYASLFGWPARSPSSPGQLISSTYLSALFIIMVYWLARMKHSDPLALMGLRPTPRPRMLARGLAGYLTAVPCLAGLLALSVTVASWRQYEPPPHPLSLFFLEDQPLGWLCYGVVFTCLLAPLVEEILFRGVFFAALRSRLPLWQAALVSGLLFGALHANWVSFIPIAWLGVVLAYLYETTGSLYVSVAVHAAHNGVMILLVFVYRALSHL